MAVENPRQIGFDRLEVFGDSVNNSLFLANEATIIYINFIKLFCLYL